MKVELCYFKPDGTFYSKGEFDTEFGELFNIWAQVKLKCQTKTLPGLSNNHDHSTFVVLVNVPEHKNNYPILINTKTCVAYYIEEIMQGLPL